MKEAGSCRRNSWDGDGGMEEEGRWKDKQDEVSKSRGVKLQRRIESLLPAKLL